MDFKVNLVGVYKGVKSFFTPPDKKGRNTKPRVGEDGEKNIVRWGWFTQHVQADENFIEFYDGMGEIWYQRFSIDWEVVPQIRDLDHELRLLYVVVHEFTKERSNEVAFYSGIGEYVSVRGVNNSTGEVWKINSVKNRLTSWTLRKIYRSVRL
jgi:hypothetical protein